MRRGWLLRWPNDLRWGLASAYGGVDGTFRPVARPVRCPRECRGVGCGLPGPYLERHEWERWIDHDYREDQDRTERILNEHDSQIVGLILAGAKAQAGAEAAERLVRSVWVRMGIVAAVAAPPATIVAVLLTYFLEHRA